MMRPAVRWSVTPLVLLAGGLAASGQAVREPEVPQFQVEQYALPNGLDVVLMPDHTTPTVAINLFYKVGSKDEQAGRTGFAHLFEHMMFQGSKNHPTDFIGPIEKLGAQINGTTNEDRTLYYEAVPANGLELALWLEADRMGFLLPALTQEKLDNQREVVKNERRQGVDNVPYGLAEEALLEALYPPGHPYHHSVIGSMADLSAASRQDVATFFRTYYAPNNCSLVVVGDFQPDEAKRLIAKYFGPIPRGPSPDRPQPRPAPLTAPKHITMTDRVTLGRTQLVWPTVPIGHKDEPALDVLTAILGGLGKESRLFRALMYDRQLAANVSAGHATKLLAGTLELNLYARPGQALDELTAIAQAEIERIKAEGPTAAEVEKVQTQQEARLVLGLQSVLSKSMLLSRSNGLLGNPLAYKDEMEALFRVTPDDVKRVANAYLTANRVRLDVTPGPQAKRPPEVDVDRKGQVDVVAEAPSISDSFDRSRMPEVVGVPAFTPPAIVRRTLSNGLEVLIVERHNLPILSLRLIARGGENLEPAGKEGLADLTTALMTEGTAAMTSLELAGALSDIGATLGASSDIESSALQLTTLTKHADRALGLFADVLLRPSFPEKELERLRKQKLAGLASRGDDAESVAGLVFAKVLYGREHPYGRVDSVKTVESLSRDDVVAFHQRLFLPNNAALAVVGDTTPDAIVARLEAALKDWKPGTAPAAPSTPRPDPTSLTVYLVDKPGAAQSVLMAGLAGPPRDTPDYFAITILNTVLGGQFSSRLNLNLREEKGYTYGAGSSFRFRRGPGPFIADAPVQTAVTKEALAEVMKELTDIRGDRPPTEDEIAFARGNTIRSFPHIFESTFGVAQSLGSLVLHHLPDDYFATYQSRIKAVTPEQVRDAAQRYIDPKHLVIVVVGDRARIEPGLKQLPFVREIRYLDTEGDPVAAPNAGE